MGYQAWFMLREEEVRWRMEDYQQTMLDNARVLWFSFVEKNRNDVVMLLP